MLEQLHQEFDKCLKNIYELDYDKIESYIKEVLSTHGLKSFKNIEYQEFNYLNVEYIDVHIYIKSIGAMTNICLTVAINKNEALKRIRKEKIKKLEVI